MQLFGRKVSNMRKKYHADGTTPDIKANPNIIFVFGSNLKGIHGAGAAKAAVKLGAKYGIGEGLQGNTYAIPTKDANLKSLPFEVVEKNIRKFIKFSKNNNYEYFVTRVGCGLAGFPDKRVSILFARAANCSFASTWKPYFDELRKIRKEAQV